MIHFIIIKEVLETKSYWYSYYTWYDGNTIISFKGHINVTKDERVDFLLLKVRLEESGSVVVKALCYKVEGCGFETQ
jgi:hypothetical protein